MKNILFYSILLTTIGLSCINQPEHNSAIITKSYKEKNSSEFCEHLDSTTNIYSNFCYHVAFDAPNNWNVDGGVSEHTIFRTHQIDSSLTFSINVIEMKSDKDNKFKSNDIWVLYQSNETEMNYPIISLIEQHYNTKVTDFNANKSFIKGNIALKRTFRYNIYDLDLEYNMSNISYQVLRTKFMFTFTLSVPTLFYQMRKEYFDSLFRNIYFLKDNETLEGFMQEIKK